MIKQYRDRLNSLHENNGFVIKAQWPSFDGSHLEEIRRAFNSDAHGHLRPSMMKNINFFGFSLWRYRRIKQDQIRIVQRNGVAELVTFTGIPQRRTKVWSFWKPWTWFRAFTDNSHTVCISNFDALRKQGPVGYGDRQLVCVEQGQYAKVMENGLPRLLGPGVHVIKSSDFHYEGTVPQSESYIKHGNCHRINVSAGKIAAIKIDNVTHLLEARQAPWCFQSNNFVLSDFHDSIKPVIQHGSLLRLMPKIGEVAVYNRAGHLGIVSPVEARDESVFCADDPNISFERFLPTNLVNVEYPIVREGSDDERYYKCRTKDSVDVGVRIYAAYKITNPDLALQKLGSSEIEKHIMCVTRTDIGPVIQQVSVQDLRSNNWSNASESFSIPDKIGQKLRDELAEYGIHLVRLNIEEYKILDPAVEKKLSETAFSVAAANAENAALDILLKNNQQKNAIKIINADNQIELEKKNVEIKELEALGEYKKVERAAEGKAFAIRTEGQAKSDVLRMEAGVMEDSPNYVAFKKVEVMSNGLKRTDRVMAIPTEAAWPMTMFGGSIPQTNRCNEIIDVPAPIAVM